jgi:hypothetical protein
MTHFMRRVYGGVLANGLLSLLHNELGIDEDFKIFVEPTEVLV